MNGTIDIRELNEMIDEEIETRQYFIGAWDGSKDFYVNCTEIIPENKEPISSEEIENQLKELIDVEVEL